MTARSTQTQAERMTRIETLLETMVQTRRDEREELAKTLQTMANDLRDLKNAVDEVKQDQTALKSKGAGFLAGAALAGGAPVRSSSVGDAPPMVAS